MFYALLLFLFLMKSSSFRTSAIFIWNPAMLTVENRDSPFLKKEHGPRGLVLDSEIISSHLFTVSLQDDVNIVLSL